ncbi:MULTISPECIES: SDR family oxidoreductase [Virgibacillus]|uniref:Oxidoreductase UxuB n=2 Tax=Virgibacillus TaxID=84406 RepID=A0ABQ2DF48_9BACI|nr:MULTISPECIES: SDR family oxidoreductase [Virgibacillus]EQB38572.1 dioxygenase [Virgibacillus sp. CM-4]MYL41286.1 SDR family NAD(P)-dependent oxidoreductase [Virgibacillus massiliensis]GGJ55832.1 putative oxidoreductase UxuB [Virgibacillus kapii]CDQ37918.1 putative oxidoreductase UxuB [Virgibacillus massiliensis]
MNQRFTGRNVIITGASGVIGKTFVKAIVDAGANVGLIGRQADRLHDVIADVNPKKDQTIALTADVLDKASLIEAKQKFNQRFGNVHALINCAGGNHPDATTVDEHFHPQSEKNFFGLREESVDYVFKLNYTGSFLPTQVFGEDLTQGEGNTIINISSMNAFQPLTKIPAYSGAKAAISNFTQWLSTYFEGKVRVNAIAPGFFETTQNKALLRNEEGAYSERAHKILSQTPMKRFGNPEELIGTLFWLLDYSASPFVTGIVVPVDGGFSSYSGV